MLTVAENISAVRLRIAAAATQARRDSTTIKLVAVSKTVAKDRCLEAVAAGQPLLGENYAQELRDKAPLVPGARWHFIGPLQRNKVKYVVGTAELIHSVSDQSLLEEIATRAEHRALIQRCLIQVNVGDEAQKSGCAAAELDALLERATQLPSVKIEGLMCIPPAQGDPRPHFVALRLLAERHRLTELSMGMSSDFESAILEGATLVRVGSAIFGARN